MNRRLLLHIVLAWALLFQPLGAIAHAWTHLGGTAQHQDDGQTVAHGACELCVAYAQAGTGLPGAGIACPAAAPKAALPDSGAAPLTFPLLTTY
ncbi:MAG: hypothetical protein ACLGH6_03975, partial [Gammaproteobacteria bacterium]